MSIYVVPQRELSFIFDEIVDYKQHCQMPGFEEASADLIEVILPEAAKFFEQLGYQRVSMKSDQEQAMRALQQRVQKSVRCECLLTSLKEYDSKSNAKVEGHPGGRGACQNFETSHREPHRKDYPPTVRSSTG